ncbi:hypothetical protein CTEN210_05016 [Chaetoceros tenuissimus]|uniref:YncE family protein n=1 Tax=Chaetoceros tenuissimus TaxID=426638 RepID=A0AAD3CPP8_9STRA|nr:hypothetical protein CTEN210_05016 [Chaetoceros tenuissimus]
MKLSLKPYLLFLAGIDSVMGSQRSCAIIANRASGEVSFVSDTQDVYSTPLPGANAEPMYVSTSGGKIFVGDRGNESVVVFDSNDVEEPRVIEGVGSGIFHQWNNEEYLVVALDEMQSIVIISIDTEEILSTIDLTNQGSLSLASDQRPHDIVITKDDVIFVSVIGPTSGDAIIRVDMDTMASSVKLDLPIGTDPHLALSPMTPEHLYSPQQGLNRVAVYKFDLSEAEDPLTIDNAHGVSSDYNGDRLYVTNISNGGTDALSTISIDKDGPSELIGTTVDTPDAVPHNIAVTKDNKIYVTHSGATASTLSLFELDENDLPTFISTINVGLNPFGLAVLNSKCPNIMSSKSSKSSKSAKASKGMRGSKSMKGSKSRRI